MLKILKNATVGDLIKGIGEDPVVQVNKWGSVKVKVVLGGTDYFLSRNEIAKKVNDLGDTVHKEWLKKAFATIETKAQSELGKKYSFKRFSHGVRSLFGKASFNFRKEMGKWDPKAAMDFQPRSEKPSELLLSGTSNPQFFQHAAQQVVNDEDWDTIDQYLSEQTDKNNLDSDDVRYILGLAAEKASPKRGFYYRLLGDLLPHGEAQLKCYTMALKERNLDSVVALNRLESVLMPFESDSTFLERAREENTDGYDADKLYRFAFELTVKPNYIWDNAAQTTHRELLKKAAEKGSGDAAYCLSRENSEKNIKEQYLHQAFQAGNRMAIIVCGDEDVKSWFLNG